MLIEDNLSEHPEKMENYLTGQVSPNQAQELKHEPGLDTSSDSSASQHSPDQVLDLLDHFQKDPEKMEKIFIGQVSAQQKQEPGLDTSSGSSSSGTSHHSPDQAQGAGYSPENLGNYFQKSPENAMKMENHFHSIFWRFLEPDSTLARAPQRRITALTRCREPGIVQKPSGTTS